MYFEVSSAEIKDEHRKGDVDVVGIRSEGRTCGGSTDHYGFPVGWSRMFGSSSHGWYTHMLKQRAELGWVGFILTQV